MAQAEITLLALFNLQENYSNNAVKSNIFIPEMLLFVVFMQSLLSVDTLVLPRIYFFSKIKHDL